MKLYDDRQTPVTFVQRIAREHGHVIDRETAKWVMWEQTGWPAFWHIPEQGATPVECFYTQLSAFFSSVEKVDGDD